MRDKVKACLVGEGTAKILLMTVPQVVFYLVSSYLGDEENRHTASFEGGCLCLAVLGPILVVPSPDQSGLYFVFDSTGSVAGW
jgi:hypothetical protein